MKALVLAGGFPQIALLQELKSRDIYTVLADYYPNPVAKPYADKFYQESTLNVEAITEIARAEKVDFLITACTDQALLTVAKVSETLGLPCYIDYQTALNVTNKQYMKKVFAKNGIPTAAFAVMGEFDENKTKDMRFPLIVKPVDCNSSKGVKKVINKDELTAAFYNAVKLSRTDTAIVEEYIVGEELSADIYIEDGRAHVLSVSSLDKIANNDKFVIFRGFYSQEKTESVRGLITEIAQKIATAFNIKNSPMLIQMIYDGTSAYVLEFSARTGGGVKYYFIRKVCGFDVISAVVDLTFGNKPNLALKEPENKYISNEFIYCSPGIFKKLVGFDELKAEGIISEYCLFKREGAVFSEIENSGDRIAGYTVQADTMEELNKKRREAVRRMRVIGEDGRDLMRRDLLEDI